MTHVSIKTFTTGWMVPSGTNSISDDPAKALTTNWMIPRGLVVHRLSYCNRKEHVNSKS